MASLTRFMMKKHMIYIYLLTEGIVSGTFEILDITEVQHIIMRYVKPAWAKTKQKTIEIEII